MSTTAATSLQGTTDKARTASLSLGRTLAFSATSLPLAAVVMAIAVHLPAYFAASIGVPLATVGAVFAICRFIDIPIEPALGIAMDRTRSRWGRFRLWTMVGTPFLMVGLYMLMQADNGVGQGYLIGWLLVMYLGLSTLLLSHAAWGATLCKTYNDRARIFGIMAAVGVIGALGILMIPIVMENLGYSDAQGMHAMLWCLIALTPISVLVVVALTPETIAKEQPGQAFRLRDYVELVTHHSMRRILLADFCLTMGPGWMAALFLFFMRDRLGFTTGQANLVLGAYILAGLFGAPFMGWLATKIGKHRSAMVASLVYSLSQIALLWAPRGDILTASLIYFASGFVAAGFGALIRAMVADVADDIRLTQGKERSGLLYSLITSTSKVALVAGTAIAFPILGALGYDPKLSHANTPGALDGLTIVFLSGPILFLALGAACFIGYKLTAEKANETRALLEAREAAEG